MVGVGRAFRKNNPEIFVVALEPDELSTIGCGETGRYIVEGIADGLIPGIVERQCGEIDEIVPALWDDALAEMRPLARRFGAVRRPELQRLHGRGEWHQGASRHRSRGHFLRDEDEKCLSQGYDS